jgi:hypothetical protein
MDEAGQTKEIFRVKIVDIHKKRLQKKGFTDFRIDVIYNMRKPSKI